MTHFSSYTVQIYSPKSILIQWNLKEFTPTFVNFQQMLLRELKEHYQNLIYLTSSFDAILISFLSENTGIKNKSIEIKQRLETFVGQELKIEIGKSFEIPVCYEDFGLDLEDMAKHTGLDPSEIIHRHVKPTYTLYFIGFLPGFLYLGHVDEQIQIPRKHNPRPRLDQGSVGIAENQTGIYPSVSPGGWQIIGRTPVNIFDVNQNPPSPFKPGDQIKFKAIDRKEFDNIYHSVKYEIKSL